MSSVLSISVRFLQPYSHGRGEGVAPEWPPSPARLFQALTAASAALWNERIVLSYAVPALQWLEQQPPPAIAAARGVATENPYLLYIPNNAAELVVPAWKKGDVTKAARREQKDVRPMHLNGEAVHYLYPLSDGKCPHFEVLQAAARSITHLGWGIDMVAGNGELLTDAQAAKLQGEVWRRASDDSGRALRVPISGTLDALVKKHEAFLGRLSKDGFKPVPPLAAFKVVSYRRATDPITRPWCAFAILKPDASGNRAFHTAHRTRDVAAWIRHAVAEVCADWPDLAAFVHGHSRDGKQNAGNNAGRRFQYLPLPTINHALNRVEAIRRVMVVAPEGCADRIGFIRKRLLGRELTWKGEVVGLLNLQPGRDWVRDQYTGSATTWSTVTPVILPGYDDHDATKTHKLICKSLADAGIEGEAEFEWQPFGFRVGVEPVRAFVRPEHLTGTMVHLRVRFKQPVRGPLAIGAGRYRGYGLLAIEG